MSVMRDVFSEYTETYQTRKESETSLMEYLELCGTDPMAFASAAERMVAAIGEPDIRSEEHTSELQSLMRISYAVFGLKKKKNRRANEHTSVTQAKHVHRR